MNEQERITDLILSEKKMAGNYDTFAAECVSDRLRDEYLKILTQGHKTQSALFKTAQAKGWYKTEPAAQSKISETYNKYSADKP